MNERNKLLKKLSAAQFAVWELHLYLDTHPCDQNAVALCKKHEAEERKKREEDERKKREAEERKKQELILPPKKFSSKKSAT